MRGLSSLATNTKIVLVSAVVAMIAASAPALAHGVEHALFAHNAGALQKHTAAQVKAKAMQVGLSRASIPTNAHYIVASTSIAVPRGGGALLATGVLNPDFQDVGTIGYMYLAVDGSGCATGAGDALWDTYSVIAESVSTTLVKAVTPGAHTVKMCALGLRDTGTGLTDTSVPFDGGQLSVTWIPAAGSVGGPSAFSTASVSASSTSTGEDVRLSKLRSAAQRLSK